jgi:hypothetical protein
VFSAFGASIAKCVAIGNLGKGDLTCGTAHQTTRKTYADVLSGYMVQLQVWVVVENNTVCLAATIPALRPLLRKSGAATSSYSYGTDDRKRKSNACHRSSDGRYKHHSAAGQHHDGNSEEYILTSVGADGCDQITKTTAVSVAFESRNPSESHATYKEGTGDTLPAFLKDSRTA